MANIGERLAKVRSEAKRNQQRIALCTTRAGADLQPS